MKAEKTKKIVTGTVFALVLLAGVFTLGFKAAHKPVVTETEETVTDNTEVQDSTEKKSADADTSKKPESKKSEVKPAKDKVKTEDKNKEKPETKAEEQAAKSDSNKPVTPKPSKPDTDKPAPAPEVKPEPAPEIKPEPAPAPAQPPAHEHTWVDITTETEEQVWVEDWPAYDETIVEIVGSHDVCNGCGCDLSSMSNEDRLHHLSVCGQGYHNESIKTETIVHHEAEGHYETQYNTAVIGRECLECGKKEYY